MRTMLLLAGAAATAEAFLSLPVAPLRSRTGHAAISAGTPRAGRSLGVASRRHVSTTAMRMGIDDLPEENPADEVKWMMSPALLQECEPEGDGTVLPLFPLGGYVYLVCAPLCPPSWLCSFYTQGALPEAELLSPMQPHSEHTLNIFEPRYRYIVRPAPSAHPELLP